MPTRTALSWARVNPPSAFTCGVIDLLGAVVSGASGSGGGGGVVVVVDVASGSGSDDDVEDGGGFGFVWLGCALPLGEPMANVAVAKPSAASPATAASTVSRPSHGRKRRGPRLDERRNCPISPSQPS